MAKKNTHHPPEDLPEGKHAPKEEADAGDRLRDYARYSGMAFQMGIIILVGTLIGRQLDKYFETSKPFLTVVMALLSIGAALYLSLKDLFSKPE